MKRAFSDKEIDWMTERVRFYIRKGVRTVYAIERAVADLRKLESS